MAKRTLSQNFLVDQNIAQKLIRLTQLTSLDNVLEIGPGKGALTHLIAPHVNSLIAIEKDHDLIPALKTLPHCEIIEADFLVWDISHYAQKGPFKVISNLPYHITSDILKKLTLSKALFTSLFLMCQYEFATKLMGGASTPLVRFVNTFYAVQVHLKIPPTCFIPPPKVTSAWIELKPNDKIPSDSYYVFLQQCFHKKRKMLFSHLKTHYPREHLEQAFYALHIPKDIRVEALSSDALFELFSIL